MNWYEISTWVLPVIMAITLHEAAHGWVALKFGDTTARDLGRVSFNPFRHIDEVGTVILPGLLILLKAPFVFGYAKPVPVDFGALHPRHLGVVAVALAGIAMNLMQAVMAALILHLVPAVETGMWHWLGMNLAHMLLVNVLLAMFNLLPIPPLDGSKVVWVFLPKALQPAWMRLEKAGLLFVFGIFLVLPWISPWNPAETLIVAPTQWMSEVILTLTGH